MWSNSVRFAQNHSKSISVRISNIFSHAPVLLHACLNQFQRFNFPISCIFDPQYLCSCDVNRSDFFSCFLDHIPLTFLPWRTILTIFGVFSLCSKPRTAAQIMKSYIKSRVQTSPGPNFHGFFNSNPLKINPTQRAREFNGHSTHIKEKSSKYTGKNAHPFPVMEL